MLCVGSVGGATDSQSSDDETRLVAQKTQRVGGDTDCDPVCSHQLVLLPTPTTWLPAFDEYFTKTWDISKGLWCAYTRQSAVVLGNNTNNRLEESWKQLKDVVDPFSRIDEVVASIMIQSLAERDFDQRVNKLAIVRNVTYDAEMSHVASLASQHRAELIYDEYVFATTRTKYYYYEGLANVSFDKNTLTDDDARDEPNVEYAVDKGSRLCSCLFASTRLLPCRHVFFLRRALQMEHVIPTHILNPRWLISSARNVERIRLPAA